MVRLTKNQRAVVKKTFTLISDHTDKFAALFYDHLFEQAPELKPLFTADMKDQGMKLVYLLATVISSIDHFERIIPQIQTLGREHLTYGVKPEYYTLVGDSLLWALEQQLAEAFTSEAKEAWLRTYTLLVDIMISA